MIIRPKQEVDINRQLVSFELHNSDDQLTIILVFIELHRKT